ncbi:class I SAM-dependent methyltransferase [Nonomuraea sp. CA-143628]|uniref:class I SAM-dependent methyltransferase n=1 Tax=Nonomuraea sp. CA-143628 TaxID=3239997 RepID=UPI003D91D55C
MSAPNAAALDRIPGWFWPADQRLFGWFLSADAPGDLLELGTYLGKSAVLIGGHLRPGETFTVCDLFESEAPDAANEAETTGSYSTLTRQRFEQNYLSVHDSLPQIVHGPTSVILNHVKADSCRFVHVDASHLYAHVKEDVLAARTVLRSDGIVAFDDYRSEHTPGVALAVWEAVAGLGLSPICVSSQKLYATWGDPAPVQRRLLAWLADTPELWHTTDILGERALVRVNQRKKPAAPAGELGELGRLSAELRRTAADLKKTAAESRTTVQALKTATKEISLVGPVVHRAVRWTRRRLTRR